MFVKVKFKIQDDSISIKPLTKTAVVPVDENQSMHCFSEAIRVLEDHWELDLFDILSVSILTDLDFLLLEDHFDIREGDVE